MASLRFGDRTINLPRSRMARIGLGVLLILGGVLWFLPVVGLWMIPLGFLVLAADHAGVRRFNRRFTVAFMRWWSGRKAKRERDREARRAAEIR